MGGIIMQKKWTGLQRYQASKPNASYDILSWELQDSPAWNALTQKQQNLYLFSFRTKFKARIAAQRNNDSNLTPTTRWADYDEVTEDCFYLNFALVVKGRKYKKWDRKTFYSDRKVLVAFGFWDLVVDGNKCYKEKSVFKESYRWQSITEEQAIQLKRCLVHPKGNSEYTLNT